MRCANVERTVFAAVVLSLAGYAYRSQAGDAPVKQSAGVAAAAAAAAAAAPAARVYENRMTRIAEPGPLLADYPEFVEPVRELVRYEGPVLVDDAGADLHVRAWRFSYNARGIVEMPNRLRASETAVIVVHPWGV